MADDEVYEREAMTGYEEDVDEEFKVRWLPVSDFEEGERIFYPKELLDVVQEPEP